MQKLKFLQNPDFHFHEIQNLSSQRHTFLGSQSSASSSDLFGWARLEGLNQIILLCNLRIQIYGTEVSGTVKLEG